MITTNNNNSYGTLPSGASMSDHGTPQTTCRRLCARGICLERNDCNYVASPPREGSARMPLCMVMRGEHDFVTDIEEWERCFNHSS
jgi:hypothetical protein